MDNLVKILELLKELLEAAHVNVLQDSQVLIVKLNKPALEVPTSNFVKMEALQPEPEILVRASVHLNSMELIAKIHFLVSEA